MLMATDEHVEFVFCACSIPFVVHAPFCELFDHTPVATESRHVVREVFETACCPNRSPWQRSVDTRRTNVGDSRRTNVGDRAGKVCRHVECAVCFWHKHHPPPPLFLMRFQFRVSSLTLQVLWARRQNRRETATGRHPTRHKQAVKRGEVCDQGADCVLTPYDKQTASVIPSQSADGR